jgi:hypothetical protein
MIVDNLALPMAMMFKVMIVNTAALALLSDE